MKSRLIAALATLVVAACLLAGCGEDGKVVEIRYDRPPKWEISENVKKLAIPEFAGETGQDKHWGDIASDKLTSALDSYNRKYHRYELVDRKHLAQILSERDVQMAIGDSDAAMEVGKIVNVDAIIYGKIHVSSQDRYETRTVPDLIRRTIKKVTYLVRYCQVTLNFTMDDIETGKTLASGTFTREYDSESDKKSGPVSIGGQLGFTGDNLPPADQAIDELINQCVQEFVAGISPHTVQFTEKLEKGKSKFVKNGNEFAAVEEWKDALDCYELAIQQKVDDHGAMFNAGLVSEAMGDLQKAQDYYDRALKLDVNSKYVSARKRIRDELAGHE